MRADIPSWALRLAGTDDVPALNVIVQRAIEELQTPYLSPEQIRASQEIMGLDTQLIEDGTYFVAELSGNIIGCGGWSRRATHFGGDHSPGRDARLLDPETEPARIRAMYTDPGYARQGIGRAIVAHCEQAAAREAFRSIELVATTAGAPLYRACGYNEVERFDERTPSGIGVPLIRMRKQL